MIRKVAGAFLLSLFFGSSGFSTTMQLLDLDQLTDAAEVIVIASVISSESAWEKNHTDIGTRTVIRVSTYLKSGTSRPGKLTLHHPGGVPAAFQGQTWNMGVDGIPAFQPGDEGTFFLSRKGANYELVGWAQGLFRILQSATGQQIVTRNLQSVSFVNDSNRPVPNVLTLNELVSEIRRHMK